MRVVYRIALAQHARDLSGQGARLNGGRWNNKGTAIIYTSESRSLAAMEYLVHVSLPDIPAGLKIVSISIPAAMKAKQVEPSDLPRNWHEYPPPFELADFGTKWVESGQGLLLRVPSAVIEHEFNVLINPQHPDRKHVKIKSIEDFMYDDRLHQAGT